MGLLGIRRNFLVLTFIEISASCVNKCEQIIIANPSTQQTIISAHLTSAYEKNQLVYDIVQITHLFLMHFVGKAGFVFGGL